MNPPTVGHEKLVRKVQAEAGKRGAEPQIYLSHSQDSKKNPLDYKTKIKIAQSAFGNVMKSSGHKTVIDIAKMLSKRGVKEIVMVVGSDRVKEFDQILNKYNGTEFKFDSVRVISAGERDPDAEGVSGMSASKLRALALSGKYDDFKEGLPHSLSSAEMKKVYNTIRKNIREEFENSIREAKFEVEIEGLPKVYMDGSSAESIKVKLRKLVKKSDMISSVERLQPSEARKALMRQALGHDDEDEEEVNEALTTQQRIKKRSVMRRLKGKIMKARERSRRRMAGVEKLRLRSRKQARNLLRQKFMKGKQYKDLPYATRAAIDKQLDRKKALVGRIAKRILPKVRKKEQERLKKFRSRQNENMSDREYLSMVDNILNELEMKTIGRSIEKNLIKKSEKYGISLAELKLKYLELQGKNITEETDEEQQKRIFNSLNRILADTQKEDIEEAIQYHYENNIPLSENIFRKDSANYYKFFLEVKRLYQENKLHNLDSFDEELLQTDIGEFAYHMGMKVPLDCPIHEEEKEDKVELGKVKKGGPKKFYVYVKDPSTGNVKKVTFGDTTGLRVKINDPKARKSFAARHKCSQQNDRTSAAYWACRLPRFAKSLGLSGGGNFFW